MKLRKLLLIITFMVFSTGNIFAQNEMKARIEFEDAELAYSNKDYNKAIMYLDNAEKLLGGKKERIEYLRILSLYKLFFESHHYDDFVNIKNISQYYLESFTTDKDKYKEIYDISSELKKYPQTKPEFEKMATERKSKSEQQQKEVELIQKLKQFKPNLGGAELGVSWEELPSSVRGVLTSKLNSDDKLGYGYYSELDKNYVPNQGIHMVQFMNKDNKSHLVGYTALKGKKKDSKGIYASFEKMKEELVKVVGEKNITIETESNEFSKTIRVKTTSGLGYSYWIEYVEGSKLFNFSIVYEYLSVE